jgi:hypothetical protein
MGRFSLGNARTFSAYIDLKQQMQHVDLLWNGVGFFSFPTFSYEIELFHVKFLCGSYKISAFQKRL